MTVITPATMMDAGMGTMRTTGAGIELENMDGAATMRVAMAGMVRVVATGVEKAIMAVEPEKVAAMPMAAATDLPDEEARGGEVMAGAGKAGAAMALQAARMAAAIPVEAAEAGVARATAEAGAVGADAGVSPSRG